MANNIKKRFMEILNKPFTVKDVIDPLGISDWFLNENVVRKISKGLDVIFIDDTIEAYDREKELKKTKKGS